MRKTFQIKTLDRIAIAGVGLLGGSIGLAVRAAGFTGTRVGIGRRASSLRRALTCDAVDETTQDPAEGVARAQLVILCTPIGRFEPLIRAMSPALGKGVYVTDVASTKAHVVKLVRRLLPAGVRFVGSHPMAGSEKTGVEFARADLFANALTLVTPDGTTSPATVRWVRRFWEMLGSRTLVISPEAHDRHLARVSHLPHAVAGALVGLGLYQNAIDLAGPGFADTTRIASGDPGLWTDIFRTNRRAMIQAVDQLIRELERFREKLSRDDAGALHEWLAGNKLARDRWIQKRYRKKVVPP